MEDKKILLVALNGVQSRLISENLERLVDDGRIASFGLADSVEKAKALLNDEFSGSVIVLDHDIGNYLGFVEENKGTPIILYSGYMIRPGYDLPYELRKSIEMENVVHVVKSAAHFVSSDNFYNQVLKPTEKSTSS